VKEKRKTHDDHGFSGLAERMGFEPMNRFWRLHTFQACAFDQLGHLSEKNCEIVKWRNSENAFAGIQPDFDWGAKVNNYSLFSNCHLAPQ